MNALALYQVAVLALATAAISLTITKGRIFTSAREWIAGRNKWLGELMSCPYCTSHWVAIVLVAIYRPVIIQQWFLIDLLVSVFAMVAMSAVICGVVIKLSPSQEKTPEDGVSEEEMEQLRSALEAARNKIIEQNRLIKELTG